MRQNISGSLYLHDSHNWLFSTEVRLCRGSLIIANSYFTNDDGSLYARHTERQLSIHSRRLIVGSGALYILIRRNHAMEVNNERGKSYYTKNNRAKYQNAK